MITTNLTPQELIHYKLAFKRCENGEADMVFYAALYQDPEALPSDLMGIRPERYFQLLELAAKAFSIGTGRAQEKQQQAVVRIKGHYKKSRYNSVST